MEEEAHKEDGEKEGEEEEQEEEEEEEAERRRVVWEIMREKTPVIHFFF